MGLAAATVLLLAPMLPAQARVEPAFATPSFPEGNVDSCAVWVAPDPADSLLFVTEKDGDRIQVWHAATGEPYRPRPFLGGREDSSAPGEFNRPNGVWVIPQVPFREGFSDVLLVTDQRNERVQVFRLPGLEYAGEFGTGEIGKGYGIAWYEDGSDIHVYITDDIPPDDHPGEIKQYRLRPEGDLLGAALVRAFGEEDGDPPLGDVESILADPAHDRLHVCDDEGGDWVWLFGLDGTYDGAQYGEPVFEEDQEGIQLYATGDDSGYIVISDQIRDGDPNEYEIFDRATLESLGHFRSPDDASLVTENTDGTWLEQRPLPGFPDGAFFAVHDDESVHVYDWTDVAGGLGLDIVPLDRPVRGVAREVPGPGLRRERSALWFHDGSWWGAFPDGDGELGLWRLEDGTFARRADLGPGVAATAVARGGTASLLALPAGPGEAPHAIRLAYRASRRAFEVTSDAAMPVAAEGADPAFTCERSATGGPGPGWAAWTEAGRLRIAASGPDLTGWDALELDGPPVPAQAVRPALVAGPEAVTVIWAREGELVARSHADGDPPASWGPEETLAARDAVSITGVAGPSGRIAVHAAAGDGPAWLGMRPPGGGWTGRGIDAAHPATGLVIDDLAGEARLVALVPSGGRRVLRSRRVELAGLDVSSWRDAAAWPGVSFHSLAFPREAPEAARDVVALALGDDGRGRFVRRRLEARSDVVPPVTLGHDPPPEAGWLDDPGAVRFRITDGGAGVDRGTLRVFLDGAEAESEVRGVPGSYRVRVPLPAGTEGAVRVRIEAQDRAEPPNVMTPFEYEVSVAPPDAPRFRRGDANGDAVVDISDAIRILLVLFAGAPASVCGDAGDADDDGAVEMDDAVRLARFLVLGEEGPAPPGPSCGLDPTPDPLPCRTVPGCE